MPDRELPGLAPGLSCRSCGDGVAALIAGHLSVANVMASRRRWRAGLITAGTVLVLMVVPDFVQDDEFSNVAVFDGRLKPVPASLVPTLTVDEFLGAIGEAKDEADQAVKK